MVTHRLTYAFVIATLSLLVACSDSDTESNYGTVSLALTTTTNSGVMYRLRGAEAVLTGPTYAVIDLDAAYVDAPVIDVRIAAGDYELGLKPGWVLERNSGQGYAPVEAQLQRRPRPRPPTLSSNRLLHPARGSTPLQSHLTPSS